MVTANNSQSAPPHTFGKIILEEGVLIGAVTIIALGITIGKGSIISGDCLLKKSIPPNTF